MREDGVLRVRLVLADRLEILREPLAHGKVDGLVVVELRENNWRHVRMLIVEELDIGQRTHSLVEPGMVGLGERHDNLVCSLIESVHPNTRSTQSSWVHERDELQENEAEQSQFVTSGAKVCARTDLEEQRRILLEEVGRLLLESCLKLLGILTRHTVPRLCLTPVH